MGEKDTDKLFGNPEILIGEPGGEMKPLKVVEDSIELDRLSVREKMQFEPLHIKPLSFDCDMPIGGMPAIIGFDEALEPSRCSLIIQSKPKINKPKNLKYPNKKRAKRIWKKWKRRFGTTPGKTIYFPDVEVESDYNGDCVSVNVKPIKND